MAAFILVSYPNSLVLRRCLQPGQLSLCGWEGEKEASPGDWRLNQMKGAEMLAGVEERWRGEWFARGVRRRTGSFKNCCKSFPCGADLLSRPVMFSCWICWASITDWDHTRLCSNHVSWPFFKGFEIPAGSRWPLMGTADRNGFPFRKQTQKFLPWSRAWLTAEGQCGLDWDVTDSGGGWGSNLSPGYLSDCWHRQQAELQRENRSYWPGCSVRWGLMNTFTVLSWLRFNLPDIYLKGNIYQHLQHFYIVLHKETVLNINFEM